MESRHIWSIAAVTAVTGFVAYAVYFDYKRRNDVDFRKKLRKEKKRVDKTVAQQSKEQLAASDISPEVLRQALQQIKNEPSPSSPEDKEMYFMNQVSMGEQLSIQGPSMHLTAALAFYRALRVYPSPVELMVIYEKTVPEPIFKLVMDMTNLDVKARIEGYYTHFPPKSANVSVEQRESPSGPRKVVVLNKDVKAGEVIYKELPVVTALDADLQFAGTHCAHCLRHIQAGMSIKLEDTILPSTYCSKECLVNSKSQSTSILFTLEPPLPPEIPAETVPPTMKEARMKAQAAFVEHLKKEGRAGPQLVARFIARQVGAETAKLVQATGKRAPETEKKPDYIGSENDDYMLADHLERLRYIEVNPPEEELSLLVAVLSSTLPGLEQFVTDERHKILLGKMAYNAYGVCFGGGRDDKPEPAVRPEEVEKTRTPYGTQRQIGSALYTLSSYLGHSCKPSARPSFSSGTAELHLIANRDLKKGEELTVAYVDVNKHPDESMVDCRRRRRIELARGWKFACPCERCADEATELGLDATAADVKDDSKYEEPMQRYGNAESAGVLQADGGVE